MYGLLASVHVVFEAIVPDTFVSAIAGNAQQANKAIRRRVRNRISRSPRFYRAAMAGELTMRTALTATGPTLVSQLTAIVCVPGFNAGSVTVAVTFDGRIFLNALPSTNTTSDCEWRRKRSALGPASRIHRTGALCTRHAF